jgi:hypothetical protein
MEVETIPGDTAAPSPSSEQPTAGLTSSGFGNETSLLTETMEVSSGAELTVS